MDGITDAERPSGIPQAVIEGIPHGDSVVVVGRADTVLNYGGAMLRLRPLPEEFAVLHFRRNQAQFIRLARLVSRTSGRAHWETLSEVKLPPFPVKARLEMEFSCRKHGVADPLIVALGEDTRDSVMTRVWAAWRPEPSTLRWETLPPNLVTCLNNSFYEDRR